MCEQSYVCAFVLFRCVIFNCLCFTFLYMYSATERYGTQISVIIYGPAAAPCSGGLTYLAGCVSVKGKTVVTCASKKHVTVLIGTSDIYLNACDIRHFSSYFTEQVSAKTCPSCSVSWKGCVHGSQYCIEVKVTTTSLLPSPGAIISSHSISVSCRRLCL